VKSQQEKKRMKTKKILFAGALLVAMASTAWAKDAVKASVSNWTGSPIVQVNGDPYARGTYAVGTIHLYYTVVGNTFTAGNFGSFDVDWAIGANLTKGGATDYSAGVTMNLQQIGGTNTVLTPDPASFFITSNGQVGKSHVSVAIGSGVPSDPELNCDGCELVGHLQLSTTPQGAKLDTVTDILVKIKLVHPTACLKVYNFVTDQDYQLGILSTTSLNVPTRGANAGKVVSSQPGQYSDNVLIANICSSAQSFDLKVGLDANFETNPSSNPGQAVFTYSTSGEVDPGSFSISGFGSGTSQGQQLCLQNVTVAAGTTFLTTVHSQVKKGVLASSLPADGSFDFAAALYQNVNSGCTGALNTMASPNPASFTLPFTTN
jgi:hypothetical protein